MSNSPQPPVPPVPQGPLVPPGQPPFPGMSPEFIPPPQKQPMPGWKIGLIVGACVLPVVSLVPLLISILIPTLGGARELARQSVCATNVKGVSTAFVMYTNQNNDEYPNLLTMWNAPLTLSNTCGGLKGSGNANNLALLVEGGVVSWGTFLCPSAKQKEMVRGWNQKMGFQSGVNGNISYALQVWDVSPNNKCQIAADTDGGVAIYGDRGNDKAFLTAWSPNHPDYGENLLYVAGNVRFSKDKDSKSFNTGGWGGNNMVPMGNGSGNNVYTMDVWDNADPAKPILKSIGTGYGLPASSKDSVLYWKP